MATSACGDSSRLAQEGEHLRMTMVYVAQSVQMELSPAAQIIFPPQPGENLMARKYSKGASKKVEGAMKKRKKGTLKSGRSGKKVKSRKQAIAIGLSEARKSGKKVPKKKTGKKGGRKKSKRKSKK
jgi:hypothetical protein